MKIDRYQRQTLLPQIGPGGQAHLGDAVVLLVGCGALGTVAATYLARAGVGYLRIVDRDLVELSNLQRQVLFDERDAQAQSPKAVAAAKKLSEANSSVVIQPVVADLNAGNIDALAGFSDERGKINLIIDGTDNVSTRYLINDFCVKHGIDWIYGGCVGVTGRVMAIRPGKTACLRCIFPEPPRAELLPTCDLAGVLGPAAAVVGAIQASIAMRLLIDAESTDPSAIGKLFTIDPWSADFRSLNTSQPQADCPCCGKSEFPFLVASNQDLTTSLCGRNAVQVNRGRTAPSIDLLSVVERLRGAGTVEQNPYFVRCRLNDPPSMSLTLFADGRLIVQGTKDAGRQIRICPLYRDLASNKRHLRVSLEPIPIYL